MKSYYKKIKMLVEKIQVKNKKNEIFG